MAISAHLATARRTTLTTCLCAALAASAAGAHPAGALPGFNNPNKAPNAQRAPFAPFAAFSNRSTSSGTHVIVVSGNTIPVTSCLDDGSDGTLRKAIESASDGDTIDMSGLSCSVITLQSGALLSGVPNLTLIGPGIDALVIDGNASDRVLTGVSLAITDLTIKDGLTYSQQGGGCLSTTGDLTLTRAKVADCSVVVSGASAPGGAAMVLGNLMMKDAEISGSTASAQQHAGGGGAFVLGTSTLYDSKISGNLAQSGLGGAYGGGLMGLGDVTLHRSAISSNRAQSSYGRAYGGGLHARGDIAVTITDESSIDDNSAYALADASFGGGINDGIESSPYASTVTITRSTVSGNTVVSMCASCVASGGGVNAFDAVVTNDTTFSYNSVLCDSTTSCVAAGGAISSFAASVAASKIEIANTTVSNNDVIGGAIGVGGGIAAGPSMYLAAKNSTIAFNHASNVAGGIASSSLANLPSMLVSTIVSNNQTDSGQNDIESPGGGAEFGGSHDLVMTWAANVTMPLDTLTLDPGLLPLSTTEGGPTAVHPLSPNSFAVDNGVNPDSLGCDQRGFPYHRVYGPRADIGAYEYQGEEHLFADNFDGSPDCPSAP